MWPRLFVRNTIIGHRRVQVVSTRNVVTTKEEGRGKKEVGRLGRLPLNSIVKVNAVSAAYNFYLPWQRKATRESSGSGFLLKNSQSDGGGGVINLVTNAHVVTDAAYVSVRKARSAKTYRAHVLALSHESDLALLGVDDPEFWEQETSAGLRLGSLPQLQDHVNVLGFPTGGDGVSVTRGVVSRIEPIQYAHGSIHLLGVQIDASINAGNSGGPALLESDVRLPRQEHAQEEEHDEDEGQDGEARVVGVAFQSLVGAENIGYIIPSPVIRHFLTQYHTHKRYSGFPQMGLQYQTLENATHRRALGLSDDNSEGRRGSNSSSSSRRSSGVLVTRIAPVSPAYAVLRSGDVITAIDGHLVANNGSVHFRNGERLYLNYLLVHKFVGDECRMDILRDGRPLSVSFVLASSSDLALVPVRVPGPPSYLVYGGLVFTRLTLPYLQEFAQQGGDDGGGGGDHNSSWYDQAPRALVHKATTELRSSLDEEVVVLSHILPDDLTAGYTHLANLELKRLNGVPITSMRALHKALLTHTSTSSRDAYMRFTFTDEM